MPYIDKLKAAQAKGFSDYEDKIQEDQRIRKEEAAKALYQSTLPKQGQMSQPGPVEQSPYGATTIQRIARESQQRNPQEENTQQQRPVAASPASGISSGLAGIGAQTVAEQLFGTGVSSGAAGATAGAGSGSLGGAAAADAAAGSSTLGTVGAYAWPLAIAVTAYNSYKNYNAAKKAAGGGGFTDAETMSVVDPYNSLKKKLPGHGVMKYLDPAFGTSKLLDKIIGSSKDDDQIYRDRMRNEFKKIGLIDDNYNLTLADGSTFNVGKDGGAMLDNVDGTNRHYYDVDFSNPLAANTVGLSNPIAEILTGGNDKLKTDFVGYLTNAALSNAKTPEEAKANVLAVYTKLGATKENVIAGLDQLKADNKISQGEYDAYVNGVNQLGLPSGSGSSGGTGGGISFGGGGGYKMPKQKLQPDVPQVSNPDVSLLSLAQQDRKADPTALFSNVVKGIS